MVMAGSVRRWTAPMVRKLIREDRPSPRYECIDGELLVTPSPNVPHQVIVSRLLYLLTHYLEQHPVGLAFTSPSDITFKDDLVQPDVFVIPFVGGVPPRQWREVDPPILAIEVLSPSSLRADRQLKRALFQREGVPEYWIVDLDSRHVERWRPADETAAVLSDDLVWRPITHVPALIIDLPDLFVRALGPET
jgi:Uma2 family endonuclease